MSHLIGLLTAPFFEVLDFTLDAPGQAAGIAFGAAVLAAMVRFVA